MLRPTKIVQTTTMVDGRAEEYTQVEITRQIGTKDKFVLYVHEQGETVVRVSNLTRQQIYNEAKD